MERTIYENYFGVKTEILQLHSSLDPSKQSLVPNVHIVLIPGNPGLPLFYRNFGLTFLRMFPDALVQMDIIGHAGHVKRAMTAREAAAGSPVYSLRFQIEHKAHYLRSLIRNLHPSTRLVLVGHSIGCFVIAELFSRDEFRDACAHLIFLMPTVQWLEAGLSPFIKHVAIKPTGLRLIGHLAEHLPKPLLRQLLSLQGDEGHASQAQKEIILDAFLCRTVIHNVFYMARTEVRDVRDLPLHLLSPQLVEKSFFMFTPSDPYTPVELVHDMTRQIPSIRAEYLPARVPHAFVGCDESIRDVCLMIYSFLSTKGYFLKPISSSL